MQLVQHIFETSFVDDGAWPIFAPAYKVVAMSRKAMEILDKVFAVFALRVNYKKGKTMVVVRFHGPGSKKAWAHFYNELGGKIEFDGWLGPAKVEKKVLLSAQTYQYMGSITDANGSLMPEVKARVGSMRGAYRGI